MKKIIKYFVDACNYMSFVSFMIITGISSGFAFMVSNSYENVWYGILVGVGFFLLTITVVHNNITLKKEIEEQKNKYIDDPEWEKYQELKNKFNNS